MSFGLPLNWATGASAAGMVVAGRVTGAAGRSEDAKTGAGACPLAVLGREDEAVELPVVVLLEELLGRTRALPAQTLQGHPILLPLLFIRCSKCG